LLIFKQEINKGVDMSSAQFGRFLSKLISSPPKQPPLPSAQQGIGVGLGKGVGRTYKPIQGADTDRTDNLFKESFNSQQTHREAPSNKPPNIFRIIASPLTSISDVTEHVLGFSHARVDDSLMGSGQRRSFTTLTDRKVIDAYTAQLRGVVEELPVVRNLKTAIEEHQFAVLYGGPSTGKTEQIEIAFGRDQKTFDLRQEFYDSTIQNEKIANTNENWYTVTTDKEKQLAWLKNNYEEIKNKLRESPATTIILDEVDLTNSDLMNEQELEAVQLILRLAEELKNKGKNVLIIFHDVGISNPEIVEEMKNRALLKENSQIINTGFLPPEIAEKFADAIGLNNIEKHSIFEFTEGSPLAFNRVLVDSAKFSKGEHPESVMIPEYHDVLREATTRTEKIWAIQKKVAPQNILELLRKLASLELSVDDPEVIEHEKALIATSLIGKSPEGQLIVPELTRDVISRETENENLSEFGVLTVLNNQDAIRSALHDHPEYDRVVEHSLSTCGSVRILRNNDGIFVIPGYNIATTHSWNTQRILINTALEMVNELVPYESDTTAHRDFSNSAKTVNELHKDAHEAKHQFCIHLEKIAIETGAKMNAGADNEFMVKTISSIESKVDRWKVSGLSEEAIIQKVNDCLRATLICKDINMLEETIKSFFELTEESEVFLGQAYSNKFQESYDLGYVGYHCNGVMIVDGKKVRFEVQFHLEDIVDGTSSSIKELSHIVYEAARGSGDTPNSPINIKALGKLFFAAGMSPALEALKSKNRIIENEPE